MIMNENTLFQVKQQIPRYESKAHAWQAVGPAFDRASPRKHTFCSKPIAYMSGNSRMQIYDYSF